MRAEGGGGGACADRQVTKGGTLLTLGTHGLLVGLQKAKRQAPPQHNTQHKRSTTLAKESDRREHERACKRGESQGVPLPRTSCSSTRDANVRRSPDSPTQMLRMSFSTRISRMGFLSLS